MYDIKKKKDRNDSGDGSRDDNWVKLPLCVRAGYVEVLRQQDSMQRLLPETHKQS